MKIIVVRLLIGLGVGCYRRLCDRYDWYTLKIIVVRLSAIGWTHQIGIEKRARCA